MISLGLCPPFFVSPRNLGAFSLHYAEAIFKHDEPGGYFLFSRHKWALGELAENVLSRVYDFLTSKGWSFKEKDLEAPRIFEISCAGLEESDYVIRVGVASASALTQCQLKIDDQEIELPTTVGLHMIRVPKLQKGARYSVSVEAYNNTGAGADDAMTVIPI